MAVTRLPLIEPRLAGVTISIRLTGFVSLRLVRLWNHANYNGNRRRPLIRSRLAVWLGGARVQCLTSLPAIRRPLTFADR